MFSPPKVVSVSPLNDSVIISSDFSLEIEFDRPVARRELKHLISPQVYGEWKFKNPLFGNHFFTKLVFVPAVILQPASEYKVQLKNIKGLISPASNNFSFTFKTSPEYNKPFTIKDEHKDINSVYTNSSNNVTMIKTSFHWQDYPLSCEAASLKMALSAKGVNVSEGDILEEIGCDKTPRKNDIWGNPYQKFVGNLNGEMCTTGYGVYWLAVAKAASNWRPSRYFSNWTVKDLVNEIKSGNPVIFWGVMPTGKLTNCSWHTVKGEYVKAYKETHVRLIVGFIGQADNPSKIIIEDPLAGELYWNTDKFLTNWKVYDNSGVVID